MNILFTIMDDIMDAPGGIEDTLNTETFLEKLIPNFWSFLVEFLALVVLIVVVFFIAYKPVKRMLKKRQDHIEENIRSAEESNQIAQMNKSESEQLIIDSKKQANEIIESAKEKAIVEQHLIEEQSKEDIAKMKERAEEEIRLKEEESLKAIHDEMVDVAIDASSELLKRNLNTDDNKRLVQDFIKEMDKEKDE